MAGGASVVSLLIFSFAFYTRGENASTSFDFSSFESRPGEITFQGNASFLDGSLQLDLNQPKSFGRAIYSKTVRIWNNNSKSAAFFKTRFSFTVVRIPNRTYYGDGFAFFLMRVGYPLRSDAIGGPLTLFPFPDPKLREKVQVVAVEFDTYRNEWDPNSTHVGINIGQIESVQNRTWDPFQGRLNVTAYAEITYDARNTTLRANFSDGKGNDAIIDAEVDLGEELPEEVSIGFAASTGGDFEHHLIRSWSFDSTFEIPSPLPLPPERSAPPPATPKEKKINAPAVAGGLAAAVVVLVAALLWFFLRRRCAGGGMNESGERMDESGIDERELEDEKAPKKFSYEELARATKNFSHDQKLGRGGFGTVYKGILNDSVTTVAVKRVAKDSRQGKKEFLAEVKIISRLRHRNLVKLLGWCHDSGELLLVYEYMPNGSLDGHLFGQTPLTWPVRYGIAKGVAAALMYLHEEWEQCVIHRDIKPSNVILDANFTAKVGDFGLSRLAEHGGGIETTALAGTMGYLAPEVATTGRASRESDVYSFGVLVLAIACGRRPIREGSPSLVEWVRDLYGKGAVAEAADERLSGEFDRGQMERLLAVGLWCAHPSSTDRPTMAQVIGVLMLDMTLPDLPPRLPAHGFGGISLSGPDLARIHGLSCSTSGASTGFNTAASGDSAGKISSKPLLDPYGR